LENREAPTTLFWDDVPTWMYEDDPPPFIADPLDPTTASAGIPDDYIDPSLAAPIGMTNIQISTAKLSDLAAQVNALPDDKKAATKAQFKKWFPGLDLDNLGNSANDSAIFGAAKDKVKNIVTGGYATNIGFAFVPPQGVNLPQNFWNNNYVIQLVHNHFEWQQANANNPNQPIVVDSKDIYFAEGFKIDPNTNKSLMLDSHAHAEISIGTDSMPRGQNALVATKFVEHDDFMFGIGNYNNQQPDPNNGILVAPQNTPLDAMKFNWAFGTGTYTIDYTLADTGKWTLKDTSSGFDATGTFGMRDPKPQ
jgi:hypothetical protein